MPTTRKRFAVLAVVGVLGVPLTVVATAFACANLAVLKLSQASARPGTEVTFVGRNFNSNVAASPVAVRFNSRNGAVLFEGRPVRGVLRGAFTVPKARAGQYIIIATQVAPNGRPAPGTPGRAPLRIRKSSTSSSNAMVIAPVTTGGGPAGPSALAIGLGLSAFMLVGGLSAIAARRRRIPRALSSTTA